MSSLLMTPNADTRLYTLDSPGAEPAILFVNGGFATIQSWNPGHRPLRTYYPTDRTDTNRTGPSGLRDPASVPTPTVWPTQPGRSSSPVTADRSGFKTGSPHERVRNRQAS